MYMYQKLCLLSGYNLRGGVRGLGVWGAEGVGGGWGAAGGSRRTCGRRFCLDSAISSGLQTEKNWHRPSLSVCVWWWGGGGGRGGGGIPAPSLYKVIGMHPLIIAYKYYKSS